MRKTAIHINLVLMLLFMYPYVGAQVEIGAKSLKAIFPAPRLITPLKDTVDLSEKNILRFRWTPHGGGAFGEVFYDLQIYRGYKMTEASLMYEAELSGKKSEIDLNSGFFKNGGTYTWSMRYRNKDGAKSPKDYHTFEVIK